MIAEVSLYDQRVLLLAPTSRDADTTQQILATASIHGEICRSFDRLLTELRRGAAAILLPEECLSPAHNAVMRELLANQPPWSDLPILVLAQTGADSVDLGDAVRTLGNVTLIERPVRTATLLSTVRTALRARERQYQIRGHLAERARTEEALRNADQRKDDFLATLGHELRNPLAPLLTALQLLHLTGPVDPVHRRVTAVMERQVHHLIRLVDDLLEVSRITRGLIDVLHEPTELAGAVLSAVEMSRPAIEAARHELSIDIPAEPVTVTGDAMRLTQVFANLLTNAAKYTNPGGHIWLTVRREADGAVVSVRDNGIGIPMAQIGGVFDMFTQIDRANRRTQGGLGIGLTLVRSLVKMHGGSVEAKSAGAGEGSEFVVRLPLGDGRPISPARLPVPAPFPRRRVLVVDDNIDACQTLGDLLTALGATVAVANSGHAAIAAVESFQPDSVLLDIGMPDLDGYEVCRQIRARSGHSALLIIALSGWGQEHDHRRSRAAGFDHHLVKPPDIDKLQKLLARGWTESIPARLSK